MTEYLHFCVGTTGYALPLGRVRTTTRMVAVRENDTVIIYGEEIPVAGIGEETRQVKATDSLIITTLREDEIALIADRIEGIRPEEEASPGNLPGTRITGDGVIIIDDLSLIPLAYGALAPDDEETATLLRRRAPGLAETKVTDEAVAYPEILRFQLGYVEYAVGMQYVREVILTGEITPVPGVPAFITGISAVRGEIISFIDLRKFFGVPEYGLTDFNRVIILSDGKMTFGLLVDRIRGTSRLRRPLPDATTRTAIPRTHLIGVAGDVVIIDGKALLTDPGMVISDPERDI
ncbi:chemotaxis signal transduction protein [Methanocalculus alkaliphilus]|uniref:chemotaxis protein CheW n=1 Tax=Methanocalculus alkaliphilus TaxID=768730 RepID=UPI00209EF1A0|nr:chemotaxis protein CheW [Methanocalculus alkaliphilus]MCP1715808.1 chemotaxis signal transduction protein [Methanocalculus alkaliphilus]